MIAHRLSTIAHSDTILVLKNGQLIEQGTHQELLARETTYKAMWEKIAFREKFAMIDISEVESEAQHSLHFMYPKFGVESCGIFV